MIKCFHPNPQAALRLFCFPYAGGSASIFRKWAENLPHSIELCAVEMPGRISHIQTSPLTRIEPLVNAIAATLLPYLDKPFAFFGHSMGGLVSFELARLLRAKYSVQPVYLFVSGRHAPQLRARTAPIHALPEPEFLVQLRRLGGTPQAVLENAELMQILIPILRADFAVLENYTYTNEPPLDCAIAAFGGLEDKEVSYEELEAWCDMTTNSFQLQMLPGDHFFLHSAQPLLNSLQKILLQAVGEGARALGKEASFQASFAEGLLPPQT